MKTIKLLVAPVIFTLLLFSCSNENDLEDRIIGKWKMTEKYDGNTKVDLGCSEYYYSEFRILFGKYETFSSYIDFEQTPQECKSSSALRSWRKSNFGYELFDFPNEILYVAYFEADNLIIEATQLPYKFIYRRFN
ncbi:hypothetical protein H9W90_08300 [Polaribacter pectinis]|uniref:Lipocalin-like domain-containing protein n=1 Tax=Polaribacter pectinis TaxID=2738844 RepID=A0A7G9L6G2_9FLAO|nr:hypothetical protein [Polaribacter pectinis]QNM84211.1 hypothetical protein H9W90_08300 [Polaribacter pectinis]